MNCNDRRHTTASSGGMYTGFLAFCLSVAVLSTCHFIEFDAAARYAYCATSPLVYHPVEKVVRVSFGLARVCFTPEDTPIQTIESSFDDILLKAGSIFAILPVASGVLSFLISTLYNPEMERRLKMLRWFSVMYGLNALFMLLALISFAADLCNGEMCQEDYECSADDKHIDYCIEECRPGVGVVVVCAASFLWTVSCIGAYHTYLSLKQTYHAMLAEVEIDDPELQNFIAKSPLLLKD